MPWHDLTKFIHPLANLPPPLAQTLLAIHVPKSPPLNAQRDRTNEVKRVKSKLLTPPFDSFSTVFFRWCLKKPLSYVPGLEIRLW